MKKLISLNTLLHHSFRAARVSSLGVLAVLATACGTETVSAPKDKLALLDPLPVPASVHCPKRVERKASPSDRDRMDVKTLVAKHDALAFFHTVRLEELRHSMAYDLVMQGGDLQNLSKSDLEFIFKNADDKAAEEVKILAQHVEKLGVEWDDFRQTLVDVIIHKSGPEFIHSGRPQDIRTHFLKALYVCDLYLKK